MTRGDLLAVAVAGALVGTLYARYWQPSIAADSFEVRSGGERLGRYSLTSNQLLTVNGRIGEAVLEVKDGRVRFRSAPCRNQVCVHSGWLAHSGDVAACLPSRISIRLLGDSRNALDGLSY